jgi:hypothetical protein
MASKMFSVGHCDRDMAEGNGFKMFSVGHCDRDMAEGNGFQDVQCWSQKKNPSRFSALIK